MYPIPYMACLVSVLPNTFPVAVQVIGETRHALSLPRDVQEAI